MKAHYDADNFSVSQVDHEFIMEFDHYLRATRKCENNTTVKYIKNFKKIIRDALAKGLISVDPFLSYKAVAAGGKFTDGEEGTLPVLSRMVLVTESLPLPIRGPGTKPGADQPCCAC